MVLNQPSIGDFPASVRFLHDTIVLWQKLFSIR